MRAARRRPHQRPAAGGASEPPPGMSLAADRFEPSRLVPFGDQPDMDPDDRSDEGGGGQVPGPGRQGARGVAAGPAETDSTE